MKKKNNKKTAIIVVVIILAAILAAGVGFLFAKDRIGFSSFGFGKGSLPTLVVKTPEKISFDNRDPFTVDVTLDKMGDALYPAASLSLAFDPLYLEFLGVEDGNIPIHSPEASYALPEWSVNVDRSNRTGQINIMYLDISGGKYAFASDCMNDEGDNVVLRLRFKLRGSARANEIYGISIEDACFAASDSTQSLALTSKTLLTVDGKVVTE